MAESSREDRVRVEAFMLWNADGRPDGRAEYYWREAEQRIDEMDRLATREDQRGEL
jgi:hypothetical protein